MPAGPVAIIVVIIVCFALALTIGTTLTVRATILGRFAAVLAPEAFAALVIATIAPVATLACRLNRSAPVTVAALATVGTVVAPGASGLDHRVAGTRLALMVPILAVAALATILAIVASFALRLGTRGAAIGTVPASAMLLADSGGAIAT